MKNRMLPFYQAIPRLLLYQFVSFIILSFVTWGISTLCSLLMGLSGKAAITSGDLGFLFTHWQGYVIIVLVLLMVLCYMAIELNALVLYCDRLLDGDKPAVWQCMKEGFAALKKYGCKQGVLLIVYAVFLAPILGFGFSISLTGSFYIPRFITSVIASKPLLLTVVIIALAVLTVYIILNCFIMHGALLGGMTLKESSAASQKLVKRNWKNFIPEILIFIGLTLLVTVILLVVFSGLPLLIVRAIPMGEQALLFWEIFFCSLLMVVLLFMMLMAISFLMIKLSTLYRKYQTEGKWQYQKKEKKRHPFVIMAGALVLAVCILFSIFGAFHFDEVFHTQITAEIIGHRAGGYDAPENTVKGIETAYELGAAGSEIDIQRTSDGYYVVNHDADFSRVAGVDKKPSEMTLAEVKELRVDGEPVPTLEETLEAARDKVVLFVELKGETADEQMADDAVRIIKEMGMEDQTVLISLKYGLLEYIEQKYPEMQTGYLAFISFGQIEETPFDYMALEEEISTDNTIEAIHNKDKMIMVWTVNEEDDIEYFMTSDADAIITDSVKLAGEIKEQLKERDPLQIIIQKILSWI